MEEYDGQSVGGICLINLKNRLLVAKYAFQAFYV